jgi:hypothetical protein
MAEEGVAEAAPVVEGGAGSAIAGVEEGVVEAALAVEGGAGSAFAGVEEAGTEEAAEAAEGEIIDTMAGANLFAFLKKAFSSERVQPWGELTFSQSKSAPCA